MEQNELVELIVKLRDMDISGIFKNKIDFLESRFKSADEKGREMLREDFTRLAKEISDASELQKK